jgi:hypothetical protein
MYIGPADPHGGDAHLDLTGAWLRNGLVGKTKLPIGDEFGNEHRKTSARRRLRRTLLR